LKLTPPDATAALADAEKATTLQPAWGKGHVRLGEALLAIRGRDDEARAAFEQGAKTSEGTVKKQAEEKAAALRR
jgi:predicted TPR repeat methyltransferase